MSAVDVSTLDPASKKQYAVYLKLLSLDKLYSRDPWRWMVDEVYTIDEATQAILPYPAKWFLRETVGILQQERLVAIVKSRRVMISWTLAAWVVWNGRYHPNHAILWQSLTEEKAAYVLDKRCAFIENNLKTELLKRNYQSLKTKSGFIGRMTYDTGSWIQAVPQGADIFRSYTPSILVVDEADFQPEAHAAFAAAIPLGEKGAKIVAATTSNGPGKPCADIAKSVGFLRFT